MSSPPNNSGAPFTPRKEFLRDQLVTRSAFALLAISGANCVRVYSFTPQTVQVLRRVLEQYAPILSLREDAAQNLCEFALDRKPWGNPKSVPTEKLLVDIIAAIYQCGYTYLSTIDYGREADDRLAMAFSKPDFSIPSASRSATPLPPPSMSPRIDGSRSSLGERPKPKRVPFAISFSSVTVMRVIAPPLHLTPAILQAVRGSWPRGVVSEKGVGGNSYEFKLKGYGWFQQDTFATDSLQHILTLLSSLDSHSFSLLTSISLTNRSRVKDLWIFTGPTSDEATSSGSEHSLLQAYPLTKAVPSSGSDSHFNPNSSHRRLATDPAPTIPHSPNVAHHPRAATESPQRSNFLSQPQVLRKPAPRAQVPVSVIQDSDIPDEQHPGLRAQIPSTISSGVENMTGIGSGHSPNVFYSTSPYDMNGPLPIPIQIANNHVPTNPIGLGSPPQRQPPSDRANSPPLIVSTSPPSPPRSSTESKPTTPVTDANTSAPLLGVGTFRDSSMSSQSELSCEIPIKWTGPLSKDEFRAEQDTPRVKPNRLSSSPMFPGGWQPTPISEKAEDETRFGRSSIEEQDESTTPIHEFDSRIMSPEIIQPDVALRKSEAALVGMIQATSSPPPPSPPAPPISQATARNESTASPGGQGWVMVNVEGSGSNSSPQSPIPTPQPVKAESLSHQATDASVVGSPLTKAPSTPRSNKIPVVFPEPSPAAKAIVIIDALESNDKKKRSASNPRDAEGSSVRRFFSLNRKNSNAALSEEKIAPSSIPRSTLRDRLRRIGTPEASRREDKRRSID